MSKGIITNRPDDNPKKGEVYEHYKHGDKYEVVGLAIHSNDDKWMVVYKPLYEDADAEMFTRPLSEWSEEVTWEGEIRKRFSHSLS